MSEPTGSTLSDLRVLDLSDGVAGVYCTKLFAGYGAEVITLEPPSGHPLRRHGLFTGGRPHRETGAPWLYLATNKRSVTLDITTRTGQRLFRRMVEEANVVVESFPPGHLDALGLGFEALRGIKRRIVLVSISPFGQTGPRAQWKATNLTSFASGGQMSLTGDPEREPLVAGGCQAEYQAGLQAFAAAAVAAYNADSLEVPQHVDISAQECMASALELYLPWWAYLKRDISQRRGNVLSAMVGVFPAEAGHIGIHIMPRNWPAFANAIGRPDLMEDERFKDNHSRLQHNDELEAIVYEWAGRQDAKQAYKAAGAAGVPIASVNTIRELLESEQLRARNYLQQIEHPIAGEQTHPGPPFRMSAVDWRPGRAPLLGEHNKELYCEEMGFSVQDLSRLNAAGVV
ncbi:MAG TPA: CoA transferase [Dehalococcoidia bacterium]|jgi:crotonobetainyl-CoA:carnitine CoA-transferase CaiB-like acyl-CoA transferase|nr:CoA transferase [Dehalococcoidia bacterium]